MAVLNVLAPTVGASVAALPTAGLSFGGRDFIAPSPPHRKGNRSALVPRPPAHIPPPL